MIAVPIRGVEIIENRITVRRSIRAYSFQLQGHSSAALSRFDLDQDRRRISSKAASVSKTGLPFMDEAKAEAATIAA